MHEHEYTHHPAYAYLRKRNELCIFCFPTVCAHTINNTTVKRPHWPSSQSLRPKVGTTKLVVFW